MKFIENLNQEKYDAFALEHPLTSIFQSSNWAGVKDNWKALYVGIEDNEILIGAALVLLKKLPGPFYFAYMPRGPLLDYADKKSVSFFFKSLKNYLRKKNVILCKFDPNIISHQFNNKEDYQAFAFTQTNPFHFLGIKAVNSRLALKKTIQPQVQLMVNLEKELPTRILKKARMSANKGVIVKIDNAENLYKMIQNTEKRHQINLRNEAYFKKMIDNFQSESKILSAYLEEELISSVLFICGKQVAESLYAGYQDAYRKYYSTYLVRTKAMEIAKENGVKWYNFGGVEGDLNDGLSEFKLSFHATICIYLGEFNLYPFPILSKIAGFFWGLMK